mgnify:CR=1 FL=1
MEIREGLLYVNQSLAKQIAGMEKDVHVYLKFM